MLYGVLGPLAVWTMDGRSVDVPEIKVRALLANLLLQDGRAVSADRLAGDLWGERPPGNPVNTLQTKVSQLRGTLGKAEPGGRDLVVYQAPGYLLRAGAEEVDARRFRALTARARATTDPRAKASLLSEALALWRGPALADFADERFAAAAIQQLEEERLVALEERAEARLALGEHNELAGELGDLVGRYPLRERLHALHLRALYRAGRQSEALERYGELRKQLAEELGLEPGPELAALHQAILRQDPELDPAPALPARPRTNLPAAFTELVGRTEAMRAVRSLVGETRLVTLTGPGGVGKTRLAVETARQLTSTFADGAWLVEFAGLDRQVSSQPEEWAAEIVASTLGIREDTAAGPLADALGGKEILLVLDNCEQVAESVAKLAARLLRAAPGLRILATSQEPLGLAGEVLWSVPPLDVPSAGAPLPGTGDVLEFSAVRLFVARASAAAPGFSLTAGDIGAVVEICRRLDGIPLALELAATKMRALGARELLGRLDDRFRLLAAGHRDAPARQRTLRAMIDWSWELLTSAERAVLRRLAVHAESYTLEAAEQVCAGDGVAGDDVLELLVRLVDRSLVVVEGTRYRLLESVAAYCVERLEEAGELDRVRRSHHHYYTELAERADARLRGHDQQEWLERLDLEAANLRSALDGAVRQNAEELALRLVNALSWYWFLRGRLNEGHRSLTTALSMEGAAPAAAKARATAWQAGMAILIGEETDLFQQAKRALKLFDDVDDPGGRAHAEWFLSTSLIGSGNLTALAELTNQALAGFRALDDEWGTAAALSTRAGQARPRGDLDAALRDGERSAALFRRLGDRWGRLKTSDLLSSLYEITGDHRQAAALHREGLRVAEELGLWIQASYELSGLGRMALLAGDYAEAGEFHRRAMRLAAEQSHKRGEQFAEVGLGMGARRQGKLDVAEAHLRNWLDWCREMDGDLGVALIMAELGFIAELRGDAVAALALHQDGFAAASATGDPRAIALATEGLAGAQTVTGNHDQAARLLGVASAIRRSIGAPLPPAERGDVDRITSAAQKSLGDKAFAKEFEIGEEMAAKETSLLISPNGVMMVAPCE